MSKKNKSKKRKFDFHEYEVLRREILLNLESYHAIRNMMYAITVTILGIGIEKQASPYIFLLPLIVILPSYMIFFEYCKATARAAAYITVFYESEPDSPIKWDMRARKLNDYMKQPFQSMTCRQTPYWICAGVSLGLYFIKILDESVFSAKYSDVLLGYFLTMITLIVFMIWRTVDEEKYLKGWNDVKEAEEQYRNRK